MPPTPSDKGPPDSMLDLPLRPGDRQTDLPFGPDRMRESRSPGQVPPAPRRPSNRARPSRKPILWGVLALIGLAVAAFLVFWPKPPEAAFSANPFLLSKVRVGAGGEAETLTITNVGERPMPIELLRLVDGDLDEFQLVEDRCGAAILEPQASCAVALVFRPARMGPRQTSLELIAEMPGSPTRLPIRGEGTAPVMVIDPSTTRFGPQDVGTSSEPLDLRVSNQGTAPLQIARVSLDGAADRDYRLTRNDCSKTNLQPGESCSLRVVFIPRASGDREAIVSLDSDALEPVPAAQLTGEGIWTGAAFAVEPQAVDFAQQLVGADASRQRVQIVNRQGSNLKGVRVALSEGAGPFRLASQDCSGKTLAPGEGCQVQVEFVPTGEGEFAGLLQIGHPDAGTLGIGLQGRGVAPRWVAGAAALEFGDLRVEERSPVRQVQLRNEGSAGAEVGQVEVAGEDRSGFVIAEDRCSGRQIDPAGSCVLQVRFEPEREGEHRADLRFRVAAGAEPQVVNLTGRATAARLSLDREMINFDRVHRTTTSRIEIQLSNRGTAPLRVRSIAIADDDAGEYRLLAGSCLGVETLPPAQRCAVAIGFSPVAEGRSTARLEIDHDGFSGPRAVPLAGIGLPPPIPKLILDQGGIDFGPQPIGNRSSIETVEIRAGGTGSLILREFTLEGEHPGDFAIVPATCHAGPTLLPGTTCAVGVRFVPTVGGRRNARLVLRHNAGTGVDRIELQGEGIGGPPG